METPTIQDTQKEFKKSFTIKSFWVGVVIYFGVIIAAKTTSYIPVIVGKIINYLPTLALTKTNPTTAIIIGYILQPIIAGLLLRVIINKIKAMLLWILIAFFLGIAFAMIYFKEILAYFGI